MDVSNFYNFISSYGPRYGLFLNPSKCELFWPSGNQTFPEFESNIRRLSQGVSLLGSPLWGPDAFFAESVQTTVEKAKTLHQLLPDLQDPQVALHLLRSCLGVCKINHILRLMPFHLISTQLQDFDNSLRFTLGELLQCSIPDNPWVQATLPFSCGGLGLRSSSRSALAAFVASCQDSKALANEMLPSLTVGQELIFFGELPGTEALLSCINSPVPSSHFSQAHLQRILDEDLFRDHIATLDIRNQACLNTLSADKMTSCWLKAPPIPSLGLAMSKPELFITATQFWLGLPLLPTASPLCSCQNFLDPYGDHILGCSHGPYRIKRHDALRDVLFYTLRQDNPNVLLEQRADGDSQSRPGDIFHPDFDNGKATFDISIRNSLQPCNITTATHTAGAAGLNGERIKDATHRSSVEASGGSFVPLVVESVGVWTPFAMRSFKTIATRRSFKNGLSPKLAYKHLLQQLSIKLWTYNARMLLHKLSILNLS